VPIEGAYRLIDLPMRNCINSGINKVWVFAQFQSGNSPFLHFLGSFLLIFELLLADLLEANIFLDYPTEKKG
ncbi:glucose-1-phosphate adenylyltransferase large subunit 1, chloroplastic-like protein, partial [Corchorus capsularis]